MCSKIDVMHAYATYNLVIVETVATRKTMHPEITADTMNVSRHETKMWR